MGGNNTKSLTPVDLIKKNESYSTQHFTEEQKKTFKIQVTPTCNAYTPAESDDKSLLEHSCVELSKKASTEVNHSYVQGYKRPKAYFTTETPQSAEEAQALWETVWQHRANVVMLQKSEETAKGYCYWSPEPETSLEFGRLTVSTIETDMYLPTLEITKLEITDENGDSLTIYHFLYFAWQVYDNLIPTHDFLRFSLIVRKYSEKIMVSEGCCCDLNPILVHCSDGLEETMIFCTIDMSISKYLQ
ncbi:tyrosine-protein phosphatase non-receptor type 9-like [Cydia pomonella]|uniref:tyrosine-protein phosphatase non-receptor type 9-like n=1 Tax=Cydia pomonella TaxID=82600 RepID=UPI002ADE706C|nr:tyrosine-protein phosphatase non-receptor type 9-like [Cydia pomonella]